MKHFALAGNPNCGKTTLFNALTGSTAHVGNWPGVTVDKKEGVYKKEAEPISIVDLPGIYSLSPYSPEELISRNYILDEKPDCVINIVDATNLERNLYLTTQIMEMDVPMVIALNMSDLLEKSEKKIDVEALEKALGIPVVAVSALKEENLDKLMHRAYETSLSPRLGKSVLEKSSVYELIEKVKQSYIDMKQDSNPLFHAIKLVESDSIEEQGHDLQKAIVEEYKKTFNDETFGNSVDAVIANDRYNWITENCSPAVSKIDIKVTEVKKKKKTYQMVEKLDKNGKVVLDKNGNPILIKKKDFAHLSDRIDRVLTNKWVGLPIFAVILFLIFHLTFSKDLFYLGAMGLFSEDFVSFAGTPYEGLFANGAINSPGVILTNLFSNTFDLISEYVGIGLEKAGAKEWTIGLINDGVVGGIFAVLGFLPQILFLFLFFSILEDSGYMARVAFILDRIFRKFGVSGRAFMPMIMGFGCSLPAMINTRTLNDEKERIATVRVIPFFSCGAKLPILTAIAGAIVEIAGIGNADLITFGMYILGVVVAFVALILMRNTTLKGDAQPFIMELPAYRLPGFKSLMLHLWDKAKHFVKKAFTIILVSNVLIWVLLHFAPNWQYLKDERINESIIAQIAMIFQPLFTPLGFGVQLKSGVDATTGQVFVGWCFVCTAVAGLIAKENVVGYFAVIAGVVAGTVFNEGEEVAATVELIRSTGITVPALIAFVAFNMTTIPCFAATATAKAELPKGKFKWTVLFWLVASYLVASTVYVIGTWLWTIPIYLVVIAGVIFGIICYRHGGVKKFFADVKANKENKKAA